MCLWMKSQHYRLLKRARNYEAVLVLGCDSATYTAQDALKNTDCHVVQGMRMVGAANATVKVRFPFTIDLEMHPMPEQGGARPHKRKRDRRDEVENRVS